MYTPCPPTMFKRYFFCSRKNERTLHGGYAHYHFAQPYISLKRNETQRAPRTIINSVALRCSPCSYLLIIIYTIFKTINNATSKIPRSAPV